jgi:hypothetical protein
VASASLNFVAFALTRKVRSLAEKAHERKGTIEFALSLDGRALRQLGGFSLARR